MLGPFDIGSMPEFAQPINRMHWLSFRPKGMAGEISCRVFNWSPLLLGKVCGGSQSRHLWRYSSTENDSKALA